MQQFICNLMEHIQQRSTKIILEVHEKLNEKVNLPWCDKILKSMHSLFYNINSP